MLYIIVHNILCKVLFELTQHKKSETNPLLIQQHFAEIRSVTSEYSAIYTDGSKDGDRVASAAVLDSRSTLLEYRLPVRSSVQKLLQYILP